MATLLEDKNNFMKISTFGNFQVLVSPSAENPEIMHVDLGAEHRKDVISMQTNKDETVDQFCMRLKSMMRALINGEPRILESEKTEPDKKKDKSWKEQKTEMKYV